ncbi:MAG TPA: hypothetical protein VFP98_02280, partial [Candidatus Polarisedimenticolia bacterium]|nr:hypothetical protein [Candidatus Polarisedimenticolia bacterium]
SAPHGRAALPVALAMATAVGILGGFIATRPGVVFARPAAAPAPARAVAADPWAPGAEILVHAVHDLAEGELTIWAGRRRLLRTPLRAAGAGPALSSGGAGSGGPSRMSTGEWSVRAPAGEHLLRVRVSGGTSGPVLTKELPLQVDADRRYRFHVRVKGPPGERLDLMWTSDGGG